MQENHNKITVGICTKPKTLNRQCSCTECDSFTCFAKRRTDQPCSCEVCTNTCQFYNNNNLTESKCVSRDIKKELAAEKLTRQLIKKEIIYEFDKNNHNMKIITKKQSKRLYKVGSTDKIEDKYDVPSKKAHSAVVTDSQASPSTAKLSAQIMDVSYKEFQKSVSKPHFPPNLSNISPFDIFNRIKEAYKACSCKVCECIAGKSLQNDLCKCKPCECNDCTSFNRQVKSFTNYENFIPNDNAGCPCTRCDRGSCKGIGEGKNREDCDCVGVQRSNTFSRDCNCEPCQCTECEPRSIYSHRTVVVAPVSEDYSRRNACQCSPCECFECRHGMRISSNLQNEMSTSIDRHPQCQCQMCANEACIPDGNQFCRCERQSKVVSKPFQQDSHDYDIRRTVVTYEDAQRLPEVNNNDTIAMFAAITNSYPKHENSTKQCDCDQCECLDCKYKASTENTCSSRIFRPIQNYQLKNRADDSKSLCDFQLCDKPDAEPPCTKHGNKCGCDVCECIICGDQASSNFGSDKHEIQKREGNIFVNGHRRCTPCECADCDKLISSCIGDICLCSNCRCENCVKETDSNEAVYPVKRGEKLTPSLFRKKIKDAFIESCISTLEENKEILKQPVALKPSMKKPVAFNSFQKSNNQDYCCTDEYEENFKENNSYHQIAPRHFNVRNETVKHAQFVKCANDRNLHAKNIEAALETNLSAYSSMSFLNKDSESITPSRCKLKSWESSCNSSGHDYPSYLIHFPKTTVETCLNDIMQFDIDTNHNINLTPIALNSKTNVRTQQNINLNAVKLRKEGLSTRYENRNNSRDIMNNQTQKFKYSAMNFEDYPYRPKQIETAFVDVNTPKEKLRKQNPNSFDKYLYTSKKGNIFMKDMDYERVQNTLQEARAFSSQLIRLLEKYERANRDFQSVSEKFKIPNISLSKEEILNAKEGLLNTLDMDQLPTKDHQQDSSGSSTEEMVEICKNTDKYNKVPFLKDYFHNIPEDQDDNISENIAISGNCNETNEGRNESGDDACKTNEVLNTIAEEREPVEVSHKYNKKRRCLTKLYRRYNKMYKRTSSYSKPTKSPRNNFSFEVDATISDENRNTPVLEIIKPAVTLNLPIGETMNIDKGFKEFNKKSVKLAEPECILKQNKSTTELRVSVTEERTKDHHTFQKDVVMIKQPMGEHGRQTVEIKKESWPIPKKNFCLGSNNITHNRKLPVMTTLETDVKTAARMISKQPTSENATYLYKNKALIKLQSEVKKLLDMPIMQTFESFNNGHKDNDILYNNLSKTSSSQTNQGMEDCQNPNLQKNANMTAASSRHSCESMKVNFLNVRRVSDHTVLVKWNTPLILNNVAGYELLVDGRAVQKILSPSRRMAVVTCLPHNEKVLLTVRTVLSSPCPDHFPAATVIYQPKTR